MSHLSLTINSSINFLIYFSIGKRFKRAAHRLSFRSMRVIKGPSAMRGRGGEGGIEVEDVREEEEREGEEKEQAMEKREGEERKGKGEGEEGLGEEKEYGDLAVTLNNVTITVTESM